MSGLPPIIHTETGTPAHEWAQSTTTAAFAREDPAPIVGASSLPPGVRQARTESSASIPGFPGAYPSENTGPTNTELMTQTAQDAMHAVTNTAQQYLPIVQETAVQAAQYAVDAASQAAQSVQAYMAGSADDAPAYSTPTVRASIADPLHQVSLPSTETSGAVAKESIGGTGALPGHVSEAAVTQLPDDRNSDSGPAIYPSSSYPSTAPADVLLPASQQTLFPIVAAAVPTTVAFSPVVPSGQHSHTAVAPLVPSGQHSSHTAVAPLASSDQHPSHEHTAVTLRESLPTQESSGQAPYTHQDGVGALPGRNSEVGVAVLPDESSSLGGATAATSSAIGTHANATSTVSRPGDGASNGSLLGGKGEQHDRVVDTQKTPSKGTTHDTGYHPAELHPMPAEMSAESQGQRTVEAKKDETKQEDAGADDHAEGAKRVRKASFIEKMKGEAKVMIGKLEGKPEKVEEGKRMKAGEA